MKSSQLLAFQNRLKVVLLQIPKDVNPPLKDYQKVDELIQLINYVLEQCEEIQYLPSKSKRYLKSTSATRTCHIAVDEFGEYELILDTKGKTPNGSKENRIISKAAKKTVKNAWRVDVWPPVEYVSAVSYGTENVAVAINESQIANRLQSPYINRVLVSETYPHRKAGIAVSLLSKKLLTLQEKINNIENINKFMIAYGLIFSLRELHKQSLVYGDISPSNVLLSQKVKILHSRLNDFGSTVAIGQKAYATPGYESPELFCYFVHTKEFQKKYLNSSEPDSLAQGFARKRKKNYDKSEKSKTNADLFVNYPLSAKENGAALENDVWSLGIILYQIFHKGKIPNYDEFTSHSHDPFFNLMITETREGRANIKKVMNGFMAFMKKSFDKDQAGLYEILTELLKVSTDPYYQSELLRDVYQDITTNAALHLCRQDLKTSEVLKAAILNKNAHILRIYCVLKMDLTKFIAESVAETNLMIRTQIFEALSKEEHAITYVLENIFQDKDNPNVELLKLLGTLDYPLEQLFSAYIRHDLNAPVTNDFYMVRIHAIYATLPHLNYKKVLDIAYAVSTDFFKHTVTVLNDLGVDYNSILHHIAFNAENGEKYICFAITAGIDLKPLFIESIAFVQFPNKVNPHRVALERMLRAGYGKNDLDFVTTHIAEALRWMVLHAPTIATAKQRLTAFGAPYDEVWGWEPNTGKLFTGLLLTLNELLDYENTVNSRFQLFRRHTNVERLAELIKIVQFFLGSTVITDLQAKLTSAKQTYSDQHLKVTLKPWASQSQLEIKLERALEIVNGIENGTIDTVTLGTSRPLKEAHTATLNVTSVTVKTPAGVGRKYTKMK